MKQKFLVFLLLAVFVYFFVWPRRFGPPSRWSKISKPEFGFSFSYRQAEAFGLNWQETYLFLLDELLPASIRLPVYWHEVEKTPGEYDFTVIDWQVGQAAQKGIPVVLAVGYRSFHRPECFAPSWLDRVSQTEFEKALLDFLTKTVQHFAQQPNIEIWQVENEPLDVFRSWCRRFPAALVAKEIEIVRTHDLQKRPIMLTFGGEIFFRPLWRDLSQKVDILGVSFYPKVWHDWAGIYIETYKLGFFSPRNLALEREEVKDLGKQFWIVEFQGEPWGPTPVTLVGPEEAARTASPEKLAEYMEIVNQAGGVERIYFWGVEWWYAELLADHPEIFEFGKSFFAGQN